MVIHLPCFSESSVHQIGKNYKHVAENMRKLQQQLQYNQAVIQGLHNIIIENQTTIRQGLQQAHFQRQSNIVDSQQMLPLAQY